MIDLWRKLLHWFGMSGTLASQSKCCQPDGSVLVSNLPGSPGNDGAAGAAGSAGKNAYTTLTANFMMPAEGATNPATVLNSDFLALNEYVFLQGEGTLQVTAIPDSTHATLKNVANSGSGLYAGNSAPGTIVSAGSRLVPAGQQGPTGSSGATPAINAISPTTSKGDLLVDNGLNNPNASVVRHGAGANGLRPVYDSTAPDGLRNDKVDLSSAAEVKNVLAPANGGNADRVSKAGDTMTGSLVISYAQPRIEIKDTSGAVDAKRWTINNALNQLNFVAVNDASSSENVWLSVTRAGVTPTRVDVLPDLYADANLIASRFLRLLMDINTTLVNGNNNDVNIGVTSFVKIKPGPTGAFVITGIVGGTDGRRLTIYNATGQNLTLSHQDVLSVASNRIVSTTGASIASTGDGIFDLIYSIDDQRWLILGSTA